MTVQQVFQRMVAEREVGHRLPVFADLVPAYHRPAKVRVRQVSIPAKFLATKGVPYTPPPTRRPRRRMR